MIDKLSYDEVLTIAKSLTSSVSVLENINKTKNMPTISDFASTVSGYAKYLETSVKLYQDADLALVELKQHKSS
jgi:hypothetical protein